MARFHRIFLVQGSYFPSSVLENEYKGEVADSMKLINGERGAGAGEGEKKTHSLAGSAAAAAAAAAVGTRE